MWSRPAQPVAIHPSQLVAGLYVWLDLPWDEHPFLLNQFRITSAKQIAEIQELELDSLYYFPNRSTAPPAPKARSAARASAPKAEVVSEVERARQEKRERLWRQKDAAARAERGWEKSAQAAREALLGLARSPRQAGEQIASLSRESAAAIAGSEEVLLHLLGDKQGEGPHYHAINVMTLALVLGKMAGLDEPALARLAMAAVAHDAGKARVPPHLLKKSRRARHEEDFYREHTAYGADLVKAAGTFPPEAVAAILDHHERADGTGWPAGKRTTSTITQVLALVNRYDRLCSPEADDQAALTPREALAVLFSKEADKFGGPLVSSLVRLLGVYPPGTIVSLQDGSLGLVIAPGRDSLRPRVLLYMPEATKDDAPIVDLGEEREMRIDSVLSPGSLPSDVLKWLNPRQRLSYFFVTETRS